MFDLTRRFFRSGEGGGSRGRAGQTAAAAWAGVPGDGGGSRRGPRAALCPPLQPPTGERGVSTVII